MPIHLVNHPSTL